MERLFPLQMIREKCKMFRVPYENLLIGCAKERLLERFVGHLQKDAETKYVFCGVAGLGIESYRFSKEKTLELRVLEDSLNDGVLAEIKGFFAGEKKTEWKYHLERNTESGYVMEIKVPFDKIEIPIRISILPSTAKKGVLQSVSLPLCYENDRYIEIPCFYKEAELAECFVQFWERLELTQDLSKLERLYKTGKECPLDGRRLSEYLEQCIQKTQLQLSTERANQFFSCDKNAHLKKRWKAYLSKEKRNEPSWEEVMGLIKNLYEPVILQLLKDEIFFGDWMPAIGRYL